MTANLTHADGKPMIREGATGDWIGTFVGHKGAVWCTRLNDPATHALTASGDFTAKLWDAITGDELATIKHDHIVKTCAFSANSEHFYTGCADKKLRLWDITRPDECAGEFKTTHVDTICFTTGLGDNQTVVSTCNGTTDKSVVIWDTRTLQPADIITMKDPVVSMSLSHDGTHVTITSGSTVSIYSVNTAVRSKDASGTTSSGPAGSGVLTLVHEIPVSVKELLYAAYLPPQKRLVLATGEAVRGFDVTTGEQTFVNRGHHGKVYCTAFRPDGQAFASSSEDGTIRIWYVQ